MSRNVDVRDPDKLSDADLFYAFDRNMVGPEVMEARGLDPSRSVTVDGPPHTRPHTGDANTKGLTQADLDAQEVPEEDLEPKEENLTEPQLQGYEPPEPVERDEEESEYSVTKPAEGWDYCSVEDLRVAAVERDLSAKGNKATLVTRLEQWETGEEEEPEEV